MADNGRWFKLWCSAVSDPNLDNLDIADFGRWCKLGAYIKEHGTQGEIILSDPSRKVTSMMQLNTFNDAILCMRKFPNITVTPETTANVSYKVKYENWLKYQGDFSSDRVKKFRAKKHQDETPMKRSKRRGEEKRREENKKREETPLAASDKIAFDSSNFKFTNLNGKLAILKDKYPAVDVPSEIRKMEGWLMANPKNIKSNYERFITNWLAKAQDSARPGGVKRSWEEE